MPLWEDKEFFIGGFGDGALYPNFLSGLALDYKLTICNFYFLLTNLFHL